MGLTTRGENKRDEKDTDFIIMSNTVQELAIG